jgi:hypothetical protein
VGILVIGFLLLVFGGFAKNDYDKWQVKQYPWGTVVVRDKPGVHFKCFGSMWTWPRAMECYFSKSEKEGGVVEDQIRVTFNGGGQADVNCYIRVQLPTEEPKRRVLHRQFGGNPENLRGAIRARLINILKNTAPVMTASEHQHARKTEFKQLVEAQLISGEYAFKKTPVVTKDETDQQGKAITVYITEIITDEQGKPVVEKESPLTRYGIAVLEFSITGTDYDPKTRELFAAKKESLLKAEQAKAARQEEVQQRLMVEEKGLREKAEMEAAANKDKAAAVIQASKIKELAEIEAQKKVEVEKQAKIEAETKAEKELSVSEIELKRSEVELKTADNKAQAIKMLAEAKEQEIQRAGMITEREQVLAEINARMKVDMTKALKDVNVPSTLLVGGSGGPGQGADMQENLMNLLLLKATGVMPDASQPLVPPNPPKALAPASTPHKK